MGSWNDDRREVETYLNERDVRRSARRKPHHLQPDVYRSQDIVWAITLCARHHGSPFSSAGMASATVDSLNFYRNGGFWRIFAYCLMPDHLHAIVQLTGAVDLLTLVSRFKRYTTTQIAWAHGLNGSLWQRDLYDHGARSDEDLDAQCRYVLDNPVRKGLVATWRDYPWSGMPDPWT